VKEGAAADQAVQQAQRRTTSRRELSAHPQFEEISPEVGQLDEDAFDDLLGADPDAALAMLADLVGATDEKLRALARRLAGRIMVELARRGRPVRRGIGRLARQRYRPDAGDLDLDASLDPIALARATSSAVDPDELVVAGWARPATALALVVDRSGSMGGRPLATAAVAAAAVAWRAPADHSVIAFSNEAIVVKSQDIPKAAERVVSDLLSLRGFGTTDVALALRQAARQLDRSNAARKVTVLLSDCRSTVPGDAAIAARALDELVIIAPEADAEQAEWLAGATGARLTTVAGPAQIPEALARVLAD
jgi:Mg-chelatase subunit ChlD